MVCAFVVFTQEHSIIVQAKHKDQDTIFQVNITHSYKEYFD